MSRVVISKNKNNIGRLAASTDGVAKTPAMIKSAKILLVLFKNSFILEIRSTKH